MPSPTAVELMALLTPSVGDFLARAKVTAACKMSGTSLDEVGAADLAKVSENLALTCESLGPEIAKKLKMKALMLGGSQPAQAA